MSTIPPHTFARPGIASADPSLCAACGLSEAAHAPAALDSFREDGWLITGSPSAWTAVRTKGTQTRVLAAHSARELLDKLLAASEEGSPPPA